MSILKTYLPATNGGRHPSGAERAEAFMREHARGNMTFATEEEAASWYLDHAEERWSSCSLCPLSLGRTRLVYGEGHPQPELVILGEAPGESEDLTGVPFVDQAGIILRRALKSPKVGLVDATIYLANVVCCRPPSNRKPEKHEREACNPRLLQLLGILKPKVILLLGASAGHMFGAREVGKSIGLVPRPQWPELGEGKARLRAVVQGWHPAWILHQSKRAAQAESFSKFVGALQFTGRVVAKVRQTEAIRARP